MQTLLNIGTIQAKAMVISELSLFSKFGIITVLELGQGATVDSNLKGGQGTEGDLHNEVFSDSPYTRKGTSAE